MAEHAPMQVLPAVGGTAVALRPRAVGAAYDLVIEATPLGGRLAWLLALATGREGPATEQVQGGRCYVIGHNRELDRHVAELIDTLVAIRVAQPWAVQLELDLGEGAP